MTEAPVHSSPSMASATSALGESLAVADGNLHLFWGSASHRAAYMATAKAMLRPLEIRGWKIARAVAVALCLSFGAAAHGAFTAEENDWLNRQRAVDGTKCCDRNDAHVGQNVEWRIVGGRYQVRIRDEWRDVPPGRLMRPNPDDPTPWPGEALLFWSPVPSHPDGFLLWCFFPEPLT